MWHNLCLLVPFEALTCIRANQGLNCKIPRQTKFLFRFGEKHLRVRLEKKEANVESLNSEHLQTGAKSRIIHFRIWAEKGKNVFFPDESYKCFCEGSGRWMLPGKLKIYQRTVERLPLKGTWSWRQNCIAPILAQTVRKTWPISSDPFPLQNRKRFWRPSPLPKCTYGPEKKKRCLISGGICVHGVRRTKESNGFGSFFVGVQNFRIFFSLPSPQTPIFFLIYD